MFKKGPLKGLTEEETKRIDQKYRYKSMIVTDVIMKLRNDNTQKLQPFIKQIYKKNKKKQFSNKNVELNFKPDPYKFKEIPKNIKTTIFNLMGNHKIGLTTLAYKCNINSHIIYNYLYSNKEIDNLVLYKILSFFHYDLETNSIIDKTYVYNNKEYINLENTMLKNIKIEPVDLKTLDLDKI